MIKKSVYDLVPQAVTVDGAKDVGIRVMLSEEDGAPNFNLRVFDVQPGGNTPRHSHPFEHELFVLEGEGEILGGDKFYPIKAYDTILMHANEEHTFKNTSDKLLRIICLVPQDWLINK